MGEAPLDVLDDSAREPARATELGGDGVLAQTDLGLERGVV